jgi:hypothetical protein
MIPDRITRLVLLVLVLGLFGCASVKAWQKETLAQPIMEFKQDGPDQSFLDHAQITVEQAEGGNGGTGGGCGCR